MPPQILESVVQVPAVLGRYFHKRFGEFQMLDEMLEVSRQKRRRIKSPYEDPWYHLQRRWVNNRQLLLLVAALLHFDKQAQMPTMDRWQQMPF